MSGPRPSTAVSELTAYRVPRVDLPMDLWLDANEGGAPPAELLVALGGLNPEVVRRYPKSARLQGIIADRFGVAEERVLLTDGSNDALERACRAVLEPGRTALIPSPTFEMLPRYARLAGGEVRETSWEGEAFPTDDALAAAGPDVALVFVVSPNNPTGAVATADDLIRLSRGLPDALLVVDLAYTEFAEEDLTKVALELPNALAVRTFSKAWGLAGLRLGCAIGPPEVVRWLRIAGQNYPVSALTLAAAEMRLDGDASDVAAYVERVRSERVHLHALLGELGAASHPSQANFVLGRFGDAAAIQLGLARRGISVRAFPGRAGLEDALRITCPGEPEAFDRLCLALREVIPRQRKEES